MSACKADISMDICALTKNRPHLLRSVFSSPAGKRPRLASARCACPGVGGLRPPRASRVRPCAVASCWSLRAPGPPVLGPRGCPGGAWRRCAGRASVGPSRGAALCARALCRWLRLRPARARPPPLGRCCAGGSAPPLWRAGFESPPDPPAVRGGANRCGVPPSAAAGLGRDYRAPRLVLYPVCPAGVLWCAPGSRGAWSRLSRPARGWWRGLGCTWSAICQGRVVFFCPCGGRAKKSPHLPLTNVRPAARVVIKMFKIFNPRPAGLDD